MKAEVVVELVDGGRVVVDAAETGKDSDIFKRIVDIGQRRVDVSAAAVAATTTATTPAVSS